jgi:hypothetical protein
MPEPEVLPSITVKVKTPDGTMFVNISERNHVPYRIDITIGKAGSAIQAWAAAMSAMLTLAVKAGLNLHILIEELSNISSDKTTNDLINGRIIRSGPDGIVQALTIYMHDAVGAPSGKITRRRRGPFISGEEV